MRKRDWLNCIDELIAARQELTGRDYSWLPATSMVVAGPVATEAENLITKIEWGSAVAEDRDVAEQHLQVIIRENPGALLYATQKLAEKDSLKLVACSPTVQAIIVSSAIHMSGAARMFSYAGGLANEVASELSTYGQLSANAVVAALVEINNDENMKSSATENAMVVFNEGILSAASPQISRQAVGRIVDLAVDTSGGPGWRPLSNINWGPRLSKTAPPIALIPSSKREMERPDMVLLASDSTIGIFFRNKAAEFIGSNRVFFWSPKTIFQYLSGMGTARTADMIEVLARAVAVNSKHPEFFGAAKKAFGALCRRVKRNEAKYPRLFKPLPENIRPLVEGGASFSHKTKDFGKLIAARVKAANL